MEINKKELQIMTTDISDYRLFTIIIPTWNRCSCLKRNLEAALPYVGKYKDKARIFVSDNASDDGTRELVEHLMESHGDVLCYHRQKENIGALNNFLDAVERTNSKYVQLFGDDDVLTPYFLPVLFELFEHYSDTNLFYFNFVSISETTGEFFNIQNKFFYQDFVRHYLDFSDFAKEHLKVPSSMTANVFNRRNYLDAAQDDKPEDFPGYFWFNKLYKSCVGKQALYYSFPMLVQYVPDEHRWQADYPWYYIYGLGHLFKELDVSCEGVYAAWQSYYWEDTYMKEIFLDIVSHNRERYQPRYGKLAEYTASPQYRKLLKIFIFYPAWVARLYVMFKKLGEFFGYLMKKS